ncbi:hypothetical protein KC19_12G078200 [Ceratodon purpureus]|uniref:Uncharacterized protein n=1 Tax=Ceratodon purpureus TaxID=3225 RepID=A0A8T0G5D4_CERPU|nr:hypothetical protein KC19_12G078200 [Ceratodon purpureus]
MCGVCDYSWLLQVAAMPWHDALTGPRADRACVSKS